LKLIRRATLALAALVSFANAGHANEWKIDALSNQVSILPEARELQESDRREFLCLALNIYFEARGESPSGKAAVAYVVINRRDSGRFAPTICSVVWQRSQFSWTVRPVGSLVPREQAVWETCQRIALAVLARQTKDPTSGALYFSAERVRGVRGSSLRIGGHTFTRPV
jgi:spore germination cell wall hydrolase CwlJ-like protein